MAPLECLGDFFCSRRKRTEFLAVPRVFVETSGNLADGALAGKAGEGHPHGPGVPQGSEGIRREDPSPPMAIYHGKYLWFNYLPCFYGCLHVAKSIAFFQQKVTPSRFATGTDRSITVWVLPTFALRPGRRLGVRPCFRHPAKVTRFAQNLAKD